MKRRTFLQQASLATAGIMLHDYTLAKNRDSFPTVRTPENLRKFKSPAVEELIATIKKNIGNKEIAWLFENCFPNTLDTTVDFAIIDGQPDTFVITGDIDAMWLRDSSAQVWPYLPLMKKDKDLQQLIKGVINRQVKCIIKDPYANAFYKDENKISEWAADKTTMKPGVHERKWEVDSLCYPIRLAYRYWKETGDGSIFDNNWKTAMGLVVKTFKEQQRINDVGPYSFQRQTTNTSDSVPLGGYGYPTKKIGLIHSMFRASDDATVYAFNIPENFFAVTVLGYLIEELGPAAQLDQKIIGGAKELAASILAAIKQYGITEDKLYGKIYAYEINGFGSHNLMDDSNVPSILSLPYLANTSLLSAELVKNSRQFALSASNPFFFRGKAAEGIGGPHVGMDYIWPMSITMRGISSHDPNEIKQCLDMLQSTHAGTGFMHESFHKDDPQQFTRKWFAWANTLFGEFVWKVYQERPTLLS